MTAVKKARVKKIRAKKTKEKKGPLWVIKIGSQLVADGGPLLIRALIQQVSQLLKEKEARVVWVSSGAIASARQRLGRPWTTLPEKQALSAIGQPMLMELYSLALQSQGLMGAQVLLGYSDFRRQESRRNLKNTIEQLLDWGVVPILNENDAVATDEIQFGDNDQLSAMVACELKAQRLLILTNVNGLFDRDPQDPKAQLIPFLDKISPSLIRKVKMASKSSLGRGGMESKLLAARRAWSQKIPTTIVNGLEPHIISRLFEGEERGTSFGTKI